MVLTRYLDGMNQALQYLSNAGDEGAKRDGIYEYLKELLVEMDENKLITTIGRKWIIKSYKT